MLIDVTHVTVQPHFTLLLEFENGERRSFNMANYIDQEKSGKKKKRKKKRGRKKGVRTLIISAQNSAVDGS